MVLCKPLTSPRVSHLARNEAAFGKAPSGSSGEDMHPNGGQGIGSSPQIYRSCGGGEALTLPPPDGLGPFYFTATLTVVFLARSDFGSLTSSIPSL